MAKLLILIGAIGLLAGCRSSSVDAGATDDMGDWQSGNEGSYDSGDHMWNGSNPNAVHSGAAVSPGPGATGTKPATGP
jgi:hypothetical protein